MKTSVRDGLRVLWRADVRASCAEVTLLRTTQGTVRGYFEDPEGAAQALAGLSPDVLRPEGCYLSLNQVRPDLLARAANRFEPYARTRVADADITRRLWLPVDIDPVRPAGISATDAERQAAIDRGSDLVAWLTTQGWPDPVLASGGNGAHALYPMDEPADAATAALIQRVLEVLHRRFSTDVVHVDTSVYNAARVWTVYGSRKRKGDPTPDRPHRRAELFSLPDPLTVLTRAQLEAVARLAPTNGGPRRATTAADGDVLDMRAEFKARGWYLRELTGGKHAVRCPWADAHSGVSGVSETVLFEPREPGGVWGFKCQHAHCTERTIKDVWLRVRPDAAPHDGPAPPTRPAPPPAEPRTLADVEALCAEWLHDDDRDPLRAVLAAYVANRRLDGDPVWLMVVGGSGIGKTERLSALCGLPDVVMASSISGQAALLSGTARKERAKDASGGLLRRIPEGGGVLVLKDFTSVIDMHREARAEVLSALREIHDGRWDRLIGAEGGRTLTWTGHLGLVAGCTTAIDSAHAVTSQMGTRFVQVRVDGTSREALADSALVQAGRERRMREALQTATRGLLTHLPGTAHPLDADPTDRLIALGCYVALARSPVDRDQQGEVRLVMDPEAPTRVVKMLGQLWRASGLLGLSRTDGWTLVRRIGLDSVPKLRRAVLDVLAGATGTLDTTTIAERVEHPSRTTRRALEDLVAHGVATRIAGGSGRADHWQMAVQARLWFDRLTLPVSSDPPLTDIPPGASREPSTSGSKNPLPANDDKTGKVPPEDGEPPLVDRVVELLERRQPLTLRAIADALGTDLFSVERVLRGHRQHFEQLFNLPDGIHRWQCRADRPGVPRTA